MALGTMLPCCRYLTAAVTCLLLLLGCSVQVGLMRVKGSSASGVCSGQASALCACSGC